jgi:lysozyme family protein
LCNHRCRFGIWKNSQEVLKKENMSFQKWVCAHMCTYATIHKDGQICARTCKAVQMCTSADSNLWSQWHGSRYVSSFLDHVFTFSSVFRNASMSSMATPWSSGWKDSQTAGADHDLIVHECVSKGS